MLYRLLSFVFMCVFVFDIFRLCVILLLLIVVLWYSRDLFYIYCFDGLCPIFVIAIRLVLLFSFHLLLRQQSCVGRNCMYTHDAMLKFEKCKMQKAYNCARGT